jgi:Domain of unknown function (DUF4440)
MADEIQRGAAAAAMRKINQAWLGGGLEDLAARVHPDIVMAPPDFSGGIQGREAFLCGFREFIESATIEEFHERDLRADVAGETAAVTFRYEMVYSRSGIRYHSSGRDLWVFQLQDGAWIAVWRAMLDMQEDSV